MAGVDRGPEPLGEYDPDAVSYSSWGKIVEASGKLVSVDEEKAQQCTESLHSLSTEIDKSLLRAVPASVVLRGFGAALRKHEFRQEDYFKSACADQLDDFISHDWASGWFGKSLVLCLLYNGRPAALASLFVGAVLAALQSGVLRVLPAVHLSRAGEAYVFGCWCQAVCPLVFAGAFVFWQDVRAALGLRTRALFLDKYCIDQVDEVRKAAGVAGLGGFIRHTDRLVICWTPRYFTRLWCTFEVASWLYLQKPMSQVEFVPLSHAKAVVLAGLVSCVACSLFTLVAATLPAYRIPLFVGGLAIVLPVSMHQLRRLIHDIRQLPAQIKGFHAKDSGCYCCEHQHRIPGQEGATLLCDREVVYETLRGWFPNCAGAEPVYGGSADAVLPAFDAEVREFFGPWVLQKAGPAQLPYSFMVLIGLPFLFRGLDTLAFLGHAFSERALRASLIEYPMDALVILPVIYKSLLHLVAWVDSKVVGIPRGGCRDILVTLACSLLPPALLLVTWFPLTFANGISLPLGLVFAGLNIAVAAVVFRQELARCRLAAWLGCAGEAEARPRRRRSRGPAGLHVPSDQAQTEMLN